MSGRARGAIALGLALAAGLPGGCRSRYTPAVEFGEALFHSPALSPSEFNAWSCATCHATTADPKAGFIPSGRTLRDAAFRESWWGGYEATLLDAVSFCLVYFMRGEPLDREDPKGRALYEYLASLSPTRPAPALPMTLVMTISDLTVPPRGDVARGREVYAGACSICHGAWPSGRGRLGPLASDLAEVFADYPQDFPGFEPALVVTEKVRHGQFFGIGGNMPLYSLEALSDEDLGALLAYLEL